DKFERLLDLIQLSDSDRLYILGDVIDRGAMGVDILQRIMAAPNMTMLLGNHEQMCLDTLGAHNEYGARDLWRQNGGSPTYRELLYHRTPHERNMILRFLASLPDHLDIVVGTQKFNLVHGCPSSDRETRIWGRVSVESGSPYPDAICIVGHTPTNLLTGRDDEDFCIWHGDGIIDIDCGCGHLRTEHRRLACLRLDDMAEFYVGGSGCGESGSLPAEELEPLDEQDLPASLQRDLDAYQKGLAEHVSYL
ncbi:metallophosphoesterase, partial [Oscillibacter sp. KLE 1745]|uniref:metallophosphoesterase n=1 Tax=Oscillibacter sp. KLE 1745 TaxID=1226323 RepID=UPI0003AE11A5